VNKVLEARSELATHFSLSPGPDLGSDDAECDVKFMPAWRRYDGSILRAADFVHAWPRASGKAVLLMSALYGLLLADDPIRDYDITMDYRAPDGSRLHAWWKHRGLGVIATECILSFRPAAVYDVLSGKYRKAVAPWLMPELEGILHHFEPGVAGFRADRRRGLRLKELLDDP
jgi:cytoplasmic iron level regulating protein YaaA (DUF328/UPF0246 family)